jgi:signal transduction histidine kinase
MGQVRVVQRTAARNATLDAVTRLFGARVEGEETRAEVERLELRARHLVEAGHDMSTNVAVAYASDLFVLCSIECHWKQQEARRLVARLAQLLDLPVESLSLQVFLQAARAPQLLDLPPAVALQTQLRLLLVLAPIEEASLWATGAAGRPVCLVDEGVTTQTRRFRTIAALTLEGAPAESAERGTILGSPVMRWETPWAAIVARSRLEHRKVAAVYLAEAAAAMSPVVEREVVLDRSATRERSLVRASERRLGRLAFDLHDGALQHIAAFGADIYMFRRQLADLLPVESQALGTARIDDLEARIWELDRVLRELAHSLEPGSLVRRPLPVVIDDEIESFTERTGIPVQRRVQGDFTSLTVSQKIALVRVVQEALTNIREHANASHVRITISSRAGGVVARIEDDGAGFHVARTVLDSAKRGRLGLVGSSERVRLLGGKFDLRSKPGSGTTVSLTLPRWRPLLAEQPHGETAFSVLAD